MVGGQCGRWTGDCVSNSRHEFESQVALHSWRNYVSIIGVYCGFQGLEKKLRFTVKFEQI